MKNWSVPKAASAPSVEGDMSEVSQYASEPVEVEGSSAGEENDVTEDWLVIEEIEEHH